MSFGSSGGPPMLPTIKLNIVLNLMMPMYMRPEGEPMYVYACHEGSHALAGILAGARVQEQEASSR